MDGCMYGCIFVHVRKAVSDIWTAVDVCERVAAQFFYLPLSMSLSLPPTLYLCVSIYFVLK